ncbi:MAG TPA: rhodanese-like domain-containing protein [Gemmatimonadaceae bacterium]|nr:rhodanese-like domain-containing protein [Gemmatimonadaceae bacterium]
MPTRLRLPLLASALIFSAQPAFLRAQQPQQSLLVSTRWLADHLSDANLVILQVGDGMQASSDEYAKQHIPGARYVTMSAFAAPRDTTSGARVLEMPPLDTLKARLEGLGISDNSRIILSYGPQVSSAATRVFFTLAHAGFLNATSVLDGGSAAWFKESRATSADVPAPKKGTLKPLAYDASVVTGDWVRDNKDKPGIAFIDARATVFYEGTQEGGPRTARKKGHIPGAKNIPFNTMTDDQQVWKSPTAIAQMFRDAGAKPGDTVVAYCHIGQQATQLLFGARLAGFKVALYDGSFEDWAYRDWPVEVSEKK